jgi:hypothetical protein
MSQKWYQKRQQKKPIGAYILKAFPYLSVAFALFLPAGELGACEGLFIGSSSLSNSNLSPRQEFLQKALQYKSPYRWMDGLKESNSGVYRAEQVEMALAAIKRGQKHLTYFNEGIFERFRRQEFELIEGPEMAWDVLQSEIPFRRALFHGRQSKQDEMSRFSYNWRDFKSVSVLIEKKYANDPETTGIMKLPVSLKVKIYKGHLSGSELKEDRLIFEWGLRKEAFVQAFGATIENSAVQSLRSIKLGIEKERDEFFTTSYSEALRYSEASRNPNVIGVGMTQVVGRNYKEADQSLGSEYDVIIVNRQRDSSLPIDALFFRHPSRALVFERPEFVEP